jgi:hypothetical protein
MSGSGKISLERDRQGEKCIESTVNVNQKAFDKPPFGRQACLPAGRNIKFI